jgi:hypothetical protein
MFSNKNINYFMSQSVKFISMGTALMLLGNLGPVAAQESRVDSFIFNRYISDLWIKDAVVTHDASAIYYPPTNCGPQESCTLSMPQPQYGITYLYLNVHTAACPTDYHIKHEITATYRDGPYYFTRSAVIEGSGEENIDRTIRLVANGNYINDDTLSNLNIRVRSECVYHGLWKPPWDWGLF